MAEGLKLLVDPFVFSMSLYSFIHLSCGNNTVIDGNFDSDVRYEEDLSSEEGIEDIIWEDTALDIEGEFDGDAYVSVCGNGVLEWEEECDDANEMQWDGCDECIIVEFQVNTNTSNNQYNPVVAVAPDMRFVIIWTSNGQDGDGDGVFGQVYDSNGFQVGLEFQVNTYTVGSQRNPSVAMASDGHFVVVWMSRDQDGDDWGIFGQLYMASGIPDGDEFQINTSTIGEQKFPDVSMTVDGRFVVVWQNRRLSAGTSQISGQLYDSYATPVGTEFQANTIDVASTPDTAISRDGGFVVVWDHCHIDPSDCGIFGRLFDPSGVPIGGDIRISSPPEPFSRNPSVAMAPDGQFVVTWSEVSDTPSFVDSIGCRQFGSDGTPVGVAFRTHGDTGHDRFDPVVSMRETNGFIAAWKAEVLDGDDCGVFGRLYNETAIPLGPEFQINIFTSGPQVSPEVAMAQDGRFVLVWSSSFQDGDASGVFAQRYDEDGNPRGTLSW